MWDLISGGISSIVSGGVTGLLGIVAQRYFDYLSVKLNLQIQESKQRHEVAIIEANGKLMAQEWASRVEVAKVESEARAQEADSAAFGDSFKMEPDRYATGERPTGAWGAAGWFMMVVIDFIRGIVRPGLTVYLCVLTTFIYFQAQAILEAYGMTISSDDAFKLVWRIIETILYLTTTCMLWWFGTRNKSQPPKLR